MEIRNLKLEIKNSSEAGVTLLLSVFIMSAVSIITLTVGFFAIQELRASKSIVLSEPAIGAANTAAEAGLWQIHRQGTMPPNCTGVPDTEVLSGSQALKMNCMAYGSAVLSVAGGTPNSFYLYDPNNINGNLNPGYTSLTATYKSGTTTLTVTAQRLNGTVVGTMNVIPGSGPTQMTLPSNPGDDNRFKVILTSTGNLSVEMNTNLGMPDFPTLNAAGCMTMTATPANCLGASESFQRRLDVLVPQ